MTKAPKIRYRDLMNGPPADADRVRASEAAPPSASATPVPERGMAAAPEPTAAGAGVGPDDPAVASAPAAAGPPAETEHGDATDHHDDEFLVFRVGRELFALRLGAVDEAIDADTVETIPQMGGAILGVVPLRGELVPLYSATVPLGVTAESGTTALIFVTPRGRVALAVDGVDDVMSIPPAELLRSPVDFGDGVLLGVTRRGADLIGVLDAAPLLTACCAEAAADPA
jgi:chemotaxis signal transduction protein